MYDAIVIDLCIRFLICFFNLKVSIFQYADKYLDSRKINNFELLLGFLHQLSIVSIFTVYLYL